MILTIDNFLNVISVLKKDNTHVIALLIFMETKISWSSKCEVQSFISLCTTIFVMMIYDYRTIYSNMLIKDLEAPHSIISQEVAFQNYEWTPWLFMGLWKIGRQLSYWFQYISIRFKQRTNAEDLRPNNVQWCSIERAFLIIITEKYSSYFCFVQRIFINVLKL